MQVTGMTAIPADTYIYTNKGLAVGHYLKGQHDKKLDETEQSFKILSECRNKFDWLIFKMFLSKN